MGTRAIYEIARYDNSQEPAALKEQVQLFSMDGALILRNSDGIETPCEGADVLAVVSSTPALREIRTGEEIQISCAPDIAANLPFALEPILDGEDAGECCADVNGNNWVAYPTTDGEYVMIPGWEPSDEPEMSPCWAEHWVQEGEWNPLLGYTSIGLATPAVVVEYANYDHGGIGFSSAVAIKPFEDFATVFVDWLVTKGENVLGELWQGDTAPFSRPIDLFAEAAESEDKASRWTAEADEDDEGEDDDEDEYGDDDSASDWSSARLKLHLSDELIAQTRVRLRSVWQENKGF
ncbi:MAG: hypothetical protein U0R66_02295 [Mycobacterium sp.]